MWRSTGYPLPGAPEASDLMQRHVDHAYRHPKKNGDYNAREVLSHVKLGTGPIAQRIAELGAENARPPHSLFEKRSVDDGWCGSECALILWRRKAVLIGFTLLGLMAAVALALLMPKVYLSRTALEVKGLNENYLGLRNIYPAMPASPESAAYVQTQAELVQQDRLLQLVDSKLHLRSRTEYQQAGDIVDRLRHDIRIEAARNSHIIEINCEARTPRLAAELCNALAEACTDQAIEARQRDARQTYDNLRPHLEALHAALRASDKHTGVRVRDPEDGVYRHFYDDLLQTAGAAWVASQIPQANIRQVGVATPASRPYKPNARLILAIGFIGGIALGVGIVMLQAQSQSVLHEPGDAAAHLAVPELGAIPRGKVPVMIERDPSSDGLSEWFRASSASIVSALERKDRGRTLIVTSAWPMEGKTTIVSNLGLALAEISRKVLLIDADMRRPKLHKVFDESNSWGLSDVLSEKNAIDELPVEVLVKKTAVPGLYLLPSGACKGNVFGLLSAERMSKLLPRFQEEFDYVLVDAPPCLEFADARIIGRHAGELLLVVRANHTHPRAAQAAIEGIRLDGLPLLGVILNRWNPGHSSIYARARGVL